MKSKCGFAVLLSLLLYVIGALSLICAVLSFQRGDFRLATWNFVTACACFAIGFIFDLLAEIGLFLLKQERDSMSKSNVAEELDG